MAQKIVAGNWKMNLLPDEGYQLIEDLTNFCESNQFQKPQVVVVPPFIHVAKAAGICAGSKMAIGTQNCSEHSAGAYTGEVSVDMINAVGARYVIVGHSERRQFYGDTDAIINKKVKAVLKAGLVPILCVGELLQDRQSGNQETVVSNQLQGALKDLKAAEVEKIVMAYEPVWAIGTGETASPDQAQQMHLFIRNYLGKNHSPSVAAEISILYGGSVKPENAREIFGQADVDGGLIGGASLKYEQFVQLITIGKEVL